MPDMPKLLKQIESRDCVVAVIGLGYVGLPLVREFSSKNFKKVIGFDVDKRKVDSLMAGKSYIRHIPGKMIAGIVKSGAFEATTDFSRLAEADAIIICVPTPLTPSKDPDTSYIEKTGASISQYLRKGQLVVLESTTYPGTTRDLLLPILEKSGLESGKDFFLAYSPEREDPGRTTHSTGTIPKLVGGTDVNSSRLATSLYAQVVNNAIRVSSAEVAEAAKILENIYRSVNIALVNELKMLFDRMNIDVWEVIEAASTKPFGFQAFYPGPGLGGHCIPIDPFYLSWKARQVDMPTRFIELAGEVNTSMPEYVVQKTAWVLNKHRKSVNGANIFILGVAYKKDVDDFRESPAFRIIELLQEQGAEISYHDPFVAHFESEKKLSPVKMDSVELSRKRLKAADLVLIVTDHSTIDYGDIVRQSNLVLDTRNATKKVKAGREKIWRA